MAELHELIEKIENPELRAQIQAAADRLTKQKKFGLVFEEHLPECTPLYDIPVRKGLKVSVRNGKANETYTVLKIENGMATCLPKNSKEAVQFAVTDLVTTAELGDPIYPCLQPLGEVCNAPDSELWHTLIEADNYHALQLLEYLYAGKVDCIYIDPPYNTGARDWKYNNDYVDGADEYRHSKWLSFMQKRLEIAKRLLNPNDSVLIVTIDEKEYLHLGCLLEEMFPEANSQMLSVVISQNGSTRQNEFSRVNEFVFILRFGKMVVTRINDNMLSEAGKGIISRTWYTFSRTMSPRKGTPKQFYPIYIDPHKRCITGIGDSMPIDAKKEDVVAPEGMIAIFPIKNDGTEVSWGAIPETAREFWRAGYLRVGEYDKKNDWWTIQYVRGGDRKRIEEGKIVVKGKQEDGSLILEHLDASQRLAFPKTVWNRIAHDATVYGTGINHSLMPDRKFPYPKSLYAVEDVLRFFIANKPNALVVDFFAGSGTTGHAVMRLNHQDNGKRRYILVTNNEVSVDEAKQLESQGFTHGDAEYEALGICKYNTFPRLKAAITGIDTTGKPVAGKYKFRDEFPMSDGLRENLVFFKLGFLDKTKVSLGMQFKELLSTLWMKAGAIGKCPVIDASVPDMLILPNNKMAILNDENQFGEFAEQLAQHPEIEVVYLVTDYESSFVAMTQALEGKKTYQLYRDYLDNFRINAGRNSR